MAKKKKRSHRKATPYKTLPTEVLDQKARLDLEQKNYRRAKDWLKELYKRDREQYLPMLVECYRFLATQMIERGQTAEAKTVLDQIRTLSGGESDLASETLLALKSGDFSTAARVFVDTYSRQKNALSQRNASIAADALVMAFEDFPQLKMHNPELLNELTAIQGALKKVCNEQFTEAIDELKNVSYHSLFSNWKLFIKGLCAFYARQDQKALEAFKRLSQDSLLSKAADPFFFLLDEKARHFGKNELKEPLLKKVCTIANKPELEYVLPRAEYLWQINRYRDSYVHVSRMLNAFPSENPGLLQALTQFYFNAVFHLGERQATKYLEGLSKQVSPSRNRPSVDYLLFLKVKNLFFGSAPDDYALQEMWEEYLSLYTNIHGENRKLCALVYVHLGNLYSEKIESNPFLSFFSFHRPRVEVRNVELAERFYEKSLELNPAAKDAHLHLLRLFETTKNKNKANRKLDEISALFPDDKETLVKNGNNCLNRKAFIKGIEYLQKARDLDPLDSSLKENLCVAYIMASRLYAKKRQAKRYRNFMDQALNLGEPNIDNFSLGHPYLNARLAAFEIISGHESEGERLLEKILEESSHRFGLSYFAYLIWKIYSVPARYVKILEAPINNDLNDPIPSKAAVLTSIILYIEQIDSSKDRWFRDEANRVTKYALEAAKKKCRPEDARKIVDYAFTRGGEGEKLRRKYIHKMLQNDSEDPFFLYLKYQDESDKGIRPSSARDLERLKIILKLAQDRNDRLLIDVLNKEINAIEKSLGFLGDLDYNDYDDDELPDLDDTSCEFINLFEKVLEEEADEIVNPFKRKPCKRKNGEQKQSPVQKTLFDLFDEGGNE